MTLRDETLREIARHCEKLREIARNFSRVLEAFVEQRKAPIVFIMSVSPQVSAWLPPAGFPRNLILGGLL